MKTPRLVRCPDGTHAWVVTKSFSLQEHLYRAFEREVNNAETTPSRMINEILKERYGTSSRGDDNTN